MFVFWSGCREWLRAWEGSLPAPYDACGSRQTASHAESGWRQGAGRVEKGQEKDKPYRRMHPRMRPAVTG